MKGFNFEKNLTHQTQAVESICSVFENIELRQEEKVKIKHAEKFFDGKLSIEFRTQFSGKQMTELISEILGQN